MTTTQTREKFIPELRDSVNEMLSRGFVSMGAGGTLHIENSSNIPLELRAAADKAITDGLLDELIPVPVSIDSRIYNEEAGEKIWKNMTPQLKNLFEAEFKRVVASPSAYMFLLGVYATERAVNYYEKIAYDGKGRVFLPKDARKK
jgi:hypothetical protein